MLEIIYENRVFFVRVHTEIVHEGHILQTNSNNYNNMHVHTYYDNPEVTSLMLL